MAWRAQFGTWDFFRDKSELIESAEVLNIMYVCMYLFIYLHLR